MYKLVLAIFCCVSLLFPNASLYAQTTSEPNSLAEILNEISADVDELNGHLDDDYGYTLGFGITYLILLVGGGVTGGIVVLVRK